jgi:hypothetical protein
MNKRCTRDAWNMPELDSEEAQLEARLALKLRQRQRLARLREICEPYLRENPNLTIGEALELDRRARPWAYRKPN